MSSNFEKFRELHRAANLLVLPNAWDVNSAVVFQENQFPAVATSSAAVAASLGYADGEGMPFAGYLFVIRRILASIRVPVTVDMEMGYGKANQAIFENLALLAREGAAGVNIEDSVINEGKRSLKEAAAFAETIRYVKGKLASENLELFINIRCDTYILDVADKQTESARRMKLYEEAGADGIFLPCISAEPDIADAVKATRLPLNVMCIPGLPGFTKLEQLGVKRVSMGPFLFSKVYKKAGELAREVAESGSCSAILQ